MGRTATGEFSRDREPRQAAADAVLRAADVGGCLEDTPADAMMAIEYIERAGLKIVWADDA